MNVPITIPGVTHIAGLGSRLVAGAWILCAMPLLWVLALSALLAGGGGPVLRAQRRYLPDGSPVDMLRFRAAPGGRIERAGADRVAELFNVARGDVTLADYALRRVSSIACTDSPSP